MNTLPLMAETKTTLFPTKKLENICNELPAKVTIATIKEAPELIPRT